METKPFNFFKQNPPTIFFDIGACDFSESIKFKTLYPNAKVYGIEADIVNYVRNKQKAESYGIETYNLAMSNVDGSTTFYPSLYDYKQKRDWRYAGSIMKPIVKPNTNEAINHFVFYDMDGVEVKTNRLDTFCKERNITHIDYLHIDVEGAEHLVLSSMGDIRPRFIFAETAHYNNKNYDNEINLDEFDELMKSLGYDIDQRFTWDTLYRYKGI